MDWYPTLATLAGIAVPEGRVIDGRDITSLLKGDTQFVPAAGLKTTLNAAVLAQAMGAARGMGRASQAS